jgi:hypothetical protein
MKIWLDDIRPAPERKEQGIKLMIENTRSGCK